MADASSQVAPGLRLVLLGPPGSGKGTQAAILAEHLGVPAISTGKMLRRAVDSGSDLGRRVESIMTSGSLVDDATMAEVVRERLSREDAAAGYILDGYPRTLAQAGTLGRILDESGQALDAVLLIEVPEDVLVQRTLARQRADDTEEVVRRRLDVYREKTEPLIEYYEGLGLLRRVDGDRSIADVNAGVREALEVESVMVLKTHGEIDLMDAANGIVHRVLDGIEQRIAPGVTTADLDRWAEEEIRAAGAVPAFLNYRGYPATLCTSVNDVIVHGIPAARKLDEGDIVGVDCGVLYQGYYGDAARTFAVGEVAGEARQLLEVTREALELAVRQVRPNAHLSDIGHAVQEHVEAGGFSVVREFVGHGIGTALHEDPQVPNFGNSGRGPRLRPGLVLAIEPMVNAGGAGVKIDSDGWTARTADGSLSAHFEFSVAVVEDGARVLGVSRDQA